MKELKEHLLDAKHPHDIIHCSFTKILQQNFQTENNDNITFIRASSPKHNINLKIFHSCLDRIKFKKLKTYFEKKKMLLSARQPPILPKLLTTAKFKRLPILKEIKEVQFFPCANFICHNNSYFKECLSFSFKSREKFLTWHYKHSFSCDSEDVHIHLLVLIVIFSILGQLNN